MQVLKSPRLDQIATGDHAEAKALIGKANQLLDEARAAVTAKDFGRAGTALDDALRAASVASTRLSQGRVALSPGAQQANNLELLEQIHGYRASILDALKEQDAAKTANAILERLDRLIDDSEKLSTAGRHEEAGKLLGEAYTAAVTAVSRLRAGQTVVLALKFDSPAGEFAYEQKRNRTHEMLLDLMLSEGKADAQKRNLVERYVGENRRLRSTAAELAGRGDYQAAIKTMEDATAQLLRALQTAGMPGW